MGSRHYEALFSTYNKIVQEIRERKGSRENV